jgi:hypothetical protein
VTARLVWLLLVLAGLASLPARAASPETTAFRAVVEEVATLIEDNYFDAERAVAVAAQLRGMAEAGRFDRLSEPQDLAAELTEVLRPRDHHFSVTWSPIEEAEQAVGMASPEGYERRNGYGFRRVEMLPGAVGYVDVRSFQSITPGRPDEPARRAADAVLALLLSGDAVIIDLRNNPGGSSTMVGYLMSAFTRPDAAIYDVIHYRAGTESERPIDSYPHPRPDIPLYVLISGRTASAAEALAYELQAAGRAVVVGEVSSGAANPGGEFPAGDGFNVFISIGTPVNPLTHGNWENKGVEPDVHVPAEIALHRAQVLALEEVLVRQGDTTDTLEAQWALEALRAEHTPRQGSPLSDYVGQYTGAVVSAAGSNQLLLKRGRRPPWTLIRINGDTFSVKDEPFRRVEFERGPDGEVRRLQLLTASGHSIWARKLPVGASTEP